MQRPKWFVSHWWGEPVKDFVKAVEKHSKVRFPRGERSEVDCDRNTADEDVSYWVCAYANNQHALDSEITADPCESAFFKAMQLCDGVLVVLDATAVEETSEQRPFWLRASVPRTRVVDDEHGADRRGAVYVHPELGVADGALARLTTEAGSLEVRVRHDPRLRPDVVDLPWGVRGAGALIPAVPRDPWTGMAAWDGRSCSLTAI